MKGTRCAAASPERMSLAPSLSTHPTTKSPFASSSRERARRRVPGHSIVAAGCNRRTILWATWSLSRRTLASARDARDRRLKDQVAQRMRSEEHTSELQSRQYLVCRLLLEKRKQRPVTTLLL